LDPNQTVYLENTPDSFLDHYYYYSISFRNCRNSTTNDNSCFPYNTSVSILNNNILAEVIILDSYADHANFSQPIQKYANRIFDSTGFTQNAIDYRYYVELEYQTDEGYVLEDLRSESDLKSYDMNFFMLIMMEDLVQTSSVH